MRLLAIVLMVTGCGFVDAGASNLSSVGCRWQKEGQYQIPNDTCAIVYALNGGSVSLNESSCNERVDCMVFGPGETLVWSSDRFAGYDEQHSEIQLVSCDAMPECLP